MQDGLTADIGYGLTSEEKSTGNGVPCYETLIGVHGNVGNCSIYYNYNSGNSFCARNGVLRFYCVVVGILDTLSVDSAEKRYKVKSYWTLVRIDRVDINRKRVYLVIPGWDPLEVVTLGFEEMPPDFLFSYIIPKTSLVPIRVYAKVNLGAEDKEDLDFKGWRLVNEKEDGNITPVEG